MNFNSINVTPKTSRSQSKATVNFDQNEVSFSPSPQPTSIVETPNICSNKILAIKSSISITKLQNDFDYAVVFSFSDSKFSLVSLCQIHTDRDQIIQVGQNYETLFGNSKHLACVKIIGMNFFFVRICLFYFIQFSVKKNARKFYELYCVKMMLLVLLILQGLQSSKIFKKIRSMILKMFG